MASRTGNGWTTWERYAPIAGVIFVALLIINIVIGPTVDISNSPAKIAHEFVHNHKRLLASSFVTLGLEITFLVYLSSLWSRFRRSEGLLPILLLLGGLGGLLLHTVAGGIDTALATRIAQHVSTDLTYSIFVAADVVGGFADLFLGVFLLAASLLILRTAVLPRWIGWIGLVGGLLGVIGAISLDERGNILGLVSFISFIVFLLFILTSSIVMLMRPGTASEPETASSLNAV